MWPGTRSLSETIMLLGMKVVDYDGLLEGGQEQSEGITKNKTLPRYLFWTLLLQ